MKFRKEFIGLDGFNWWVGVVENRLDPLGLGRCQVRIFGIHTESLSDIPSEDLPWAQPVHALNNQTFSTPKEGDYVFGFFLDGKFSQSPIMIGIIPGIPTDSPITSEGFNDLRPLDIIKESPKKPISVVYKSDGTGVKVGEANTADNDVLESLRHPQKVELGVPQNSNLARGVTSNTIVSIKKSNPVTVETAGGVKWDEPPAAYGTEYPFNKVLETESGHVLEFDDTPGSERIQIAHRAGSFSEWYPSGSKVEKISKNNYKIVLSDDYIYVTGKVNITVGSDANIRVVGDVNVQGEGDMNVGIAGDTNFTVGGDFKVKAGGGIYLQSSSDTNIKSGGGVNMQSSSDTNVKSGGGVNLESSSDTNIKSGGAGNFESSSELNLKAGGSVALDGSTVEIFPMLNVGPKTNMLDVENSSKIYGQGAQKAGGASSAGDATDSGLGSAPNNGSKTSAPLFLEKSPKVIITPIQQLQVDKLTTNYVANPSQYRNPNAAANDVKENYAGTPDISTGESLIVNTPGSDDLSVWLGKQLALAKSGYWAETGMGGAPSNKNILNIWDSLGFGNKGAWGSDQTAWCMGFVNYSLKMSGYRFLQTARAYDIRDRASAYKAQPVTNINQAKPGDIVLWNFSHVNFVYTSNNGSLTFVGGNQASRGRGNNNNPSGGDVTNSWPGGWTQSKGGIIGIWRPVKE